MKITTIKITDETKKRLLALDLVTKEKSFDIIVNELIIFYEEFRGKRKKDYKRWQKEMNKYEESRKDYEKEMREYLGRKEVWDKLLKWARTQGFRG